jgi:hypothetical protein
MGQREVHAVFWWGKLKEGAHFEDTGVNGRTVLKWMFEKLNGAWTESIWLSTGTVGRLL